MGMGVAWAFVVVAVPFLWAAGLTVLGYPHPSFLLADACFILGGAVLLGMMLVWAIREWPLRGLKLAGATGLVVMALCGSIGGVLWASSQKAAAQNPPPNFNGNCNNFGNYNVNCNTFNFGPRKAGFDTALAEGLVQRLPAGKPINLVEVGSAADIGVADQYAQYLKDKGFTVNISSTAILVPPPSKPFTVVDAGAAVNVIIAPGIPY